MLWGLFGKPEEPPRQSADMLICCGVPRSGRWPAVRAAHLRKSPACVACGARQQIEIHHIEAYHLRPELELVDENLITLCHNHHLELGHGGDWKLINPRVIADAKYIAEMYARIDRGD